MSRALFNTLALCCALFVGATSASAEDLTSSAPDRARFVSVTRTLQERPFEPGAKSDGAWAIQWLTDAPDLTVNACLTPLGGLDKDNYPYDSELVVQYMLSMGVLAIEHPESAKDQAAQQLAGVEGTLKTYQAMLKEKPQVRSPSLDKLLALQSQGKLPDFVRKAWVRCTTEK